MQKSKRKNNYSRFSGGYNSSNNNTTIDSQSEQSIEQDSSDQSDDEISEESINQSDQSSDEDIAVNEFIDNAADESVIIPSTKKRAYRRIIQSDSESDENRVESEAESDDAKSERGSESDENRVESEAESDDAKSERGSESDERDEESLNEDKSGDENDSEHENQTDEGNEDKMNVSFGQKSLNQSVASNGSMHKSYRDDQTAFNVSGSSESDRSVQNDSNSTDVVIPESDDEEEGSDDGDANERSQIHVFSPRTRRSITGRRSIKPMFNRSDDEEDDEIFTDEIVSNDTNASHSSDYKSAEDSKDNDNFKRNRSIAPNDSTIIKTPNAKRFSHNISSSTPSRSITETPNIDFTDKSIEAETSSIQISSSHSEIEMKSISSDSVVLLNSSDEENHKPNMSTIDFKGVQVTSTPGTSGKLIQPKLPFGRKQQQSNKQYVSRDYYNKKEEELIKQKNELTSSEELFGKLGHTLPDKGFNLKKRIADIKRDIAKRETELETYAIEEDNLAEAIRATNNNQPTKNTVTKDWRDELETIQPKHTGQQGMATFNTQKTLTLNRIEKLHKAMEKCPAEHDLARQPDNLNVQLMPHQLYAIKWMRWRESQRPKGGLLADDMGLGKTLTVIGLVLDAKYRKQQSLAEEDEDEEENSEDENEDESDDENERGFKKSYPNQGGTLIICPASLINQWESEVNNRVRRRKLSVLLVHGNKRNESVHSMCKYDLVITTYGIISSDHKNNGALFRIRWDRIVLDEAHMIRNHSTAVAKGCSELRGTMRWGLTGTPIQNKHMDVYSMLKFLRVTPFDDLATFKKWIDPKTQAGMSRLHNILKPLLLRRTKAELQIKGELQALPSKTMIIEEIELTHDEANIYTKILAYSQTLFAQYMEQHQQRNGGGKLQLDGDIQKRLEQVKKFGRGQDVKSSQILVLLLRLRQICDHPGLIHQMLQDECDLDDCDEEEYDSTDMNIVKQMIGLKINEDGRENNRHNSSSDDEVKSNNILLSSNKMYDFKQPSSKCKRTIDIVKRILRETNDKVVVVSQWTSFLTIVADLLHRERVHYVELNGKTPIKERNNIVVSFNNPDSSERVMMLSLVAGGVGLNLTGANHLILLDPHWNPQLESQAFDRVYRVGQTKDVNIYKLLCVKTVEKHIQSIQDAKLELSDNVLTGSKQSSGSKLSIQDMRRLFDM